MSIDKKAFGLSDSLINAVSEALKGGQVKIDVAQPKGKTVLIFITNTLGC
jgi:hypothetical protein